jgi:hexosaminidase
MNVKVKVLAFLLVVLMISCTSKKMPDRGIIPQPNYEVRKDGDFRFRSNTVVYADPGSEALRTAEMFIGFMKDTYGLDLDLVYEKPLANAVLFLSTQDEMKNGAYSLSVSRDNIIIRSSSYSGLFYGFQSLKQLLTPQVRTKYPEISCIEIKDEPAFQWRGFMLDVSRHFYPVDSIKKILDVMAMHKMNKFHWHLVDVIGWRIEIDKYPLLTKKGAWRVTEPKDQPWSQYEICFENDPRGCYGGFYSKDEVRDIVNYAAERYIDVIPEIEMPGHSHAALQCYPEYSCPGLPNAGVYCAGNDKVFDFLEDILREVMELFPYEYVHVGGDEVWKSNWEKCSLCRKRMKDEHLKDVNELQSYFIKRMEKFISSKGKKLIGWDEILEGGLPARATVMSWRGEKGGIEAANEGHDVVMSPTKPLYLDYKQSSSKYEPASWGEWPNTLMDIYNYYPIPMEIAPDKKYHILGAQGNLWTEKVATFRHLQYMMLPRLCALSEAVWTYPENKNGELFRKKIITDLDRLKNAGFHYAESVFSPMLDVEYDRENGTGSVRLYNEMRMYDIRYTIDGSYPGPDSELYTIPITFNKALHLKALCFRNEKPVGFLLEKDIKEPGK